MEAETSHYAAAASAAAGISGLNSIADWGALDCIFYRITIERPYMEQSHRRLALLNKKVNFVLTNLVYLLIPPQLQK